MFEIKEWKGELKRNTLAADRSKSVFCFKIVWLQMVQSGRHKGKNMFTFFWSFDTHEERQALELGGFKGNWQDYEGIKALVGEMGFIAKHQAKIKEVVIFPNHSRRPLGLISVNAAPPPSQRTWQAEGEAKPKKSRKKAEPTDPDELYSQTLISLEQNPDLAHLPHEELKQLAKLYHTDRKVYNEKIQQIMKELYAQDSKNPVEAH
jgi:hypothetical protein